MKKVYLLGDPVEHSISPQMHNAAYAELGIEYNYEAIKVSLEDLENKVQMLRSSDVAGANITVPHKEHVIKLLDEIDPNARSIGAVNTIKNNDGKLIGYNTDSKGFIDSLKEDGCISPEGKNVMVLGAGGAARAICVALFTAGVPIIYLFDIFESKAKILSADLTSRCKCGAFKIITKEEINESIMDVELLINASPVGMHPKFDSCPVPDDAPFHKDLFVYDLVYNPSETKLIKLAKAKGSNGITGLGMLVRQGAASFEIFTGVKPSVDTMFMAARKALS